MAKDGWIKNKRLMFILSHSSFARNRIKHIFQTFYHFLFRETPLIQSPAFFTTRNS
jgi:hypothetical protein